MKDTILSHLDHPAELERLYQADKLAFKRTFLTIYDEIQTHPAARFWYERLSYQTPGFAPGRRYELGIVVILSLLAGIAAKIPVWFQLDAEVFFSRNVGLLIFPFLTAYFAWKRNIRPRSLAIAIGITLLGGCYINLLPKVEPAHTLTLACLHFPLFLWSLFGWVFAGDEWKQTFRRMEFLRFNADLLIMTGLILIAGVILTGVTFGLFSLIDVDIEAIYIDYVVVLGLVAAPLVGAYVTQTNPQLVSRVSPVIATLFSPLVLVTLVAYLATVIVSGKNPYNDRDFLLLFNVLLIGVMAIVLFAMSESTQGKGSNLSRIIVCLLALVTIVVNLVALSAIVFRIAEWGVSPNKLAVLGGNLLILSHLVLVTRRLLATLRNPAQLPQVEQSIASFLPVYSVWTFVVVFIFPLIFGFD
jgi:hypothetical protein